MIFSCRKGGSGNPGRGLARRQAFLDAAAELFLEKGFERTSLSDIVQRSKGSRSTLYEQFGGKDGLLRAMIEETADKVWENIHWEETNPSFCPEDVEDIARRFLRAALAPNAIAIYRIVVAEGHRFPEIARLFYDAAPLTAVRRLTEWFSQALARSGKTIAIKPEQLARIFLWAVIADVHDQRVMGLPSTWTDEATEEHIQATVRIILRGIGLG